MDSDAPTNNTTNSKDSNGWNFQPWKLRSQFVLLVIFLVCLLPAMYLFSIGGPLGVLGGVAFVASWFALIVEMAGGKQSLAWVIAGTFTGLIGIILLMISASGFIATTYGTKTDATITKLHHVYTANSQGVPQVQLEASLKAANGKTIYGRLNVTGDNDKLGSHVEVYYFPDKLMGPTSQQDANLAKGTLIAAGIFFLPCIWPVATSVQSSIKRYKKHQPASAPTPAATTN